MEGKKFAVILICVIVLFSQFQKLDRLPNVSADTVEEVNKDTDYVSLLPEADSIENYQLLAIKTCKNSKKIPKVTNQFMPKNGEDYSWSQFWQLDGDNNLNVLFYKNKKAEVFHYVACTIYKEKDKKVTPLTITWNEKTQKALNIDSGDSTEFSILAQWMDSESGDLYLIVAHQDTKNESSEATLYAIDKKGKLITQKSIDDNLILDKIPYWQYTPGFSIDYLEKKNDIVYLSYSDASNNGVACYDVKKQCFVKQIITSGRVKGIVHNKTDQLVGVQDNNLILSDIPKGKTIELENGSKLKVGKSSINQVYKLPTYQKIAVNGSYIYLLTKTNYMRFIPGKDQWVALANVSSIIKNKGQDTYISGFVAKDAKNFAIVFYGDCGSEYFVNSYTVQ